MPNVTAALFIAKVLDRPKIEGKRVLDVGSCDFNGSVAPLIKSWGPSSYTGVDIISGPGVDIVCPAEGLEGQFGIESFDVLVCVEMLEHAKDWRGAINNMKAVLKPGGHFALTTRSFGYPCHGFPHDYWRYEEEDIRKIFSDFEIIQIEKDLHAPGIFIYAKKPLEFRAESLESLSLYSIALDKKVLNLPEDYQTSPYYRNLQFKQWIKSTAGSLFLAAGRAVSKILGIK